MWIELAKTILLGIVEGFTEILPISSTGHLIVFGDQLEFTGRFAKMFEIVIQLGPILAVIWLFREKLIKTIQDLKPGGAGFEFWLKMFIAFLPSAVIGLLFHDIIEEYLFTSFTVGVAQIVGGILLIVLERWFTEHSIDNVDDVCRTKSLLIGFSQCFALVPGMSRSASTILGGLALGLTPKVAAEFSFFLAIPTMIAATGYSLFKDVAGVTLNQMFLLGVGFVVSFVVAHLVVERFMNYLANKKLAPFGYYRIALGFVILLMLYY